VTDTHIGVKTMSHISKLLTGVALSALLSMGVMTPAHADTNVNFTPSGGGYINQGNLDFSQLSLYSYQQFVNSHYNVPMDANLTENTVYGLGSAAVAASTPFNLSSVGFYLWDFPGVTSQEMDITGATATGTNLSAVFVPTDIITTSRTDQTTSGPGGIGIASFVNWNDLTSVTFSSPSFIFSLNNFTYSNYSAPIDDTPSSPPAPVSEPSTLLVLLLAGMGGLALNRKLAFSKVA
jgi:hypothetical protein